MQSLIPVHEPEDQDKVEALADSMDREGWVGAPLVRKDDELLTGAHRFAAVELLNKRWERYEAETNIEEIPTIEVEKVFDEAGLDYYEMCEEYCLGYSDDMVQLLNQLPEGIRGKYGIDLH